MIDQIVVSLALEGVPVRAIARSMDMPAPDIRQMLGAAVDRGEIVELPRDDWPPGQCREQRLPAVIHGVPLKVQLFARVGVSGQPAKILLMLLRYGTVTVEQLVRAINTRSDTTQKQLRVIHVVMFKLRDRLVELGYGTKEEPAVRTLWGQGYELPSVYREALLKKINDPDPEVKP